LIDEAEEWATLEAPFEGLTEVVPLVEPPADGFDASTGWPLRSVTWAKSVPFCDRGWPEMPEK
jgi:hypothetical protein